jgi:Holliday junction resolvase RusA-like endonuclease
MKDTATEECVQPWLNLGEKSACYTIDGPPISLKRPRFGLGHVFDSQKREKFGASMQLKSQHEYPLPFDGPLKLEVTFYMPMPKRMAKKNHVDGRAPHSSTPDIDNLLKFLLDCANKVIIKDDALVAYIVANKIYSNLPRTEFTIMRLEPNGSK